MPSEEYLPKGDLEKTTHTPPTHSISGADAYDLQNRAHSAEQKLSIERNKLTREIGKSRRLQCQVNEYVGALARSVHDCGQMRYHCQLLSNSNLALSQELQKAKMVVKTLQAVIQTLHTSSPDKLGSTNSVPSNDQHTS